MVEEDSGSVRGGGCGLGGYEMHHLGEGVDKDDNGIKASLGDRELCDEVHGHLFPGSAQSGERLQETSGDLLTRLDALTGIAGLHIVSYVIVHLGPIEERVNGSVGSFDSLMSGDGGIVMVVEDLCLKGTLWDAEAVKVVVKDSIGA